MVKVVGHIFLKGKEEEDERSSGRIRSLIGQG